MADGFARHPAAVQAPAATPWPESAYPRGEWQLVALEPDGEPLKLAWPGVTIDGPATMRLAVGLDDRSMRHLAVSSATSGKPIAEFEIPFACPLQPVQLELTAEQVGIAQSEGLACVVKGGDKPLTFAVGPGLDEALVPQLMVGALADQKAAFRDRMVSDASLAQFGWMEGCALDGLWWWSQTTGDARLRAGFDRHLAHYPDIAEHCRGIESTLMIAALARVEEENAPLGHAVDFWWARQDQHGCILDGTTTSCEGSYTIAYPLAAIAKRWNDATLGEVAAHQLRLRRDRLAVDGDIWLRYRPGGKRTYRSWARGCAWYMIGLARTLVELGALVDTADLKTELAHQAAMLIPKQNADGLWHAFIDEPKVATDSSGSAGIATALAIGAAEGWLDGVAGAAARKTLDGLWRQLTDDGLLGGVCPSNKGEYGEAGQRRPYRAIMGMGMGLMASLLAALGEPA